MVGAIVLLRKNYQSKYTLCRVLNRLPGVSRLLRAKAEEEIELIGYHIGEKTGPNKDRIELTFFWRALRQPERDYSCFMDIADKDGKAKYRFIKPIAYRIYPSYAWRRGEIIKEDYKLLLPQDAGDGFSVKMGIFDYKDRKIYSFVSSVPDGVDNDGRINLIIKNN